MVLSGTDLYRDLPDNLDAARSLDYARRIVVLQDEALRQRFHATGVHSLEKFPGRMKYGEMNALVVGATFLGLFDREGELPSFEAQACSLPGDYLLQTQRGYFEPRSGQISLLPKTPAYMASGGDGYPVLFGRAVTRELIDQVVADYIAVQTPISPAPSAT